MLNNIRTSIQRAVYLVIDKPIRLAVRIGFTPNIVTTVGLLGNIAAAVLFVFAAYYGFSYTLIGWGGALILLSSMMDMVDGRMARLCNMSSAFGAFYDSVLDRYCELITLSAISFLFFAAGHNLFALFTLLSLIGSVMVSYVRARAEALGIQCKVGLLQRPERVVLTSVGALLCGVLCHEAWLAGSQLLIAMLANLTALHRIWHVYSESRE